MSNNKSLTLRQNLESPAFARELAKALPKHLTPDRMIRVACTAIMRSPKLAQCDQTSFFNAMLTCSQMGLEPDGRRAHLIPYDNRKRGVTECQLIIDYKGLVELAIRSGQVSNLHADVVCENDVFEVNLGEIREHKIDYRKPRGEVYAAYAICRFKDGSTKSEVMTVEEIERIRSRSRAGNSGPWQTDWNEMAKKTVFRRLTKWLPLSPEVTDALDADGEFAPEKPTVAVEAPSFFEVASTVEDAKPAKPEPEGDQMRTIQEDLEAVLDGVEIGHFSKWAGQGGYLPDWEMVRDWNDLPEGICSAFLQNQSLIEKAKLACK